MERLLLTTEKDAPPSYSHIEVQSFPDGDSYVCLPTSPKGKDVVIFSRCYPNQNSRLIELLLIISTAAELGASSVHAFIPYLPYARQDKRVKAGEAVSSNILCSLLKAAGITELITLDCHFLKRSGTFEHSGLQLHNLSAAPFLLEEAKKGLREPLVITPDQGAAYLAKGEDARVMEKKRGEYGKQRRGSAIYRPVASLKADFDVRKRDVIIIDDIIAGGSTMLKAVQLCRKGGARSITCAATHGQFLNGADKKIKAAGAKRLIATDAVLSIYSTVRSLDVAGDSI